MTVRRLIEEELPLEAVAAAVLGEKRFPPLKGHISTVHLWWARRPLAMSRAIVFGTLLPDPQDDTTRDEILGMIAEASPFERSNDLSRLNPLRKLLAEAYPPRPPKVLDCFAGGGAIPLEAVRLGCETTALDLNPVAFVLLKACLEYPQKFGQRDRWDQSALAFDLERWAEWVEAAVAEDLDAVFPCDETGNRPAVHFWCRTMRCQDPACGKDIPLVRSRWLAKSEGRKAWIEFDPNVADVSISVHTSGTPSTDPGVGTVKASSVTCPACGTSASAKEVRDYGKTVGFGARLYAVLAVEGKHRRYRVPTKNEIVGALNEAARRIADLPELPDGTSAVPDERCDPNGFRRVQSLVFGIETFAELFNVRQRYVLSRLSAAVRQAHRAMIDEGLAADYAAALTTYLGLAVDRLADYDSSFCGWDAGLEKVRSTFPRQAIAMTWDYAEVFPFAVRPGVWKGALRWIAAVIRHCSQTSDIPARVVRGDAQHLPFKDGEFDAVVVDPPYYDAIQYSYLSDFFYVWLKRSVGFLYPGEFATNATPKKQEVVQNQAKKTSAAFVSSDEFDRRLRTAIAEMARVLKPDGVMSLVFAHTEVTAWEKLLRALRSESLIVSTSWPMRSEMANRSTASIHHAVLGSSIVLVCKKADSHGEGFFGDVVRELESRIGDRLDRFERMGLVGADYFASAVGPAFEVFAKYSRVVRLSGEEVGVSDLMTLARQVVARRAMGKLLGDESVSSLDPVSLLYLTWRWAYQGESIPADEAFKLERALDVDLSTMLGPHGLAERSGATFSLRGPDARKGLHIGLNPLMIDVLHTACVLWEAGRRKELEQLLCDTGMGASTAFWSLARALAEVLPEGNRERTMLLGLTGNQEALANAAAKAAKPGVEQQRIDWGGVEQKTLLETGPVQERLAEE